MITPEDAREWIELVIQCSTRVVEKAVALRNPRSAVPESLKYISGDTLELKLAVSEDWAKLLASIKDLLSQKSSENMTTEKALFMVMQEFHQRHDPVSKAKRALKKKTKSNGTIVDGMPRKTVRVRSIPAKIKHFVHLRDQGQCSYVLPSGERCSAKRWLDIHHIQHFADGGRHNLENLETLCRGHHQMKHSSH